MVREDQDERRGEKRVALRVAVAVLFRYRREKWNDLLANLEAPPGFEPGRRFCSPSARPNGVSNGWARSGNEDRIGIALPFHWAGHLRSAYSSISTMAARATWKGFLKISLLNIPIKVVPATESSGTISFHQLHGECQTRIQQKRWCSYHNREVPNSEIVKGYEFEKGRYVVLSEEDFDKVRPESTRVIDLVQFADDSAIDPMYVDRTYYLAPDGKMAGDAFAVMREGMKGKVGIGKLALYGREYLVAVRPQERGIVMYTLHHAAEIRSIDTVEEPALGGQHGEARGNEARPAGDRDVRGAARFGQLQGRIPRGVAAHHRSQDRRRRDRRAGRRGTSQGRQPDGCAEEKPRRGEHQKEETCESRSGPTSCEAQTR